MISIVRGRIADKSATEVTVDVGGIGFFLSIPLSTSQKIGEIGDEVTLWTKLEVSKDNLRFYGFSTKKEREFFELLTSVQGIGPGIGLKLLSGLDHTALEKIIEQGDVHALSEIRGVGRKKAERIIFELRRKISQKPGINEDAIKALVSLGLKRNEAKERLKRIPNIAGLSLPEILKIALKNG